MPSSPSSTAFTSPRFAPDLSPKVGVGMTCLLKIGEHEAERPRPPEDESGRLKRLLAGAMLDNAGLKDVA